MAENDVRIAVETAHAHGKRVAAHCRVADSVKRAVRNHVDSPQKAANCHRDGCTLICYLGDVWLLQRALANGIGDIRKLTGH